jgi:hypothetical protein
MEGSNFKKDFDQLPGHGKPLSQDYLKGDAFDNILKNANYLPAWVDLQQKIRSLIGQLIVAIDKQEELNIDAKLHGKLDKELDEINKHIRKYNQIVPNPSFQKGLISLERIKQQYERWE